MSQLVVDARVEAERLVRPLGRRWLHVQAVARSGRAVAGRLQLDGDVLEAACWLHDIGYAPVLRTTDFHPLDGARYLRAQGWDPVVVDLVAHHSCARFEARERGLAAVLEDEFSRPPAELEDALCFCDMTNGPAGEAVPALNRLDEIEDRYGPDHVVTGFIKIARPEILAAVGRVQARLVASDASV